MGIPCITVFSFTLKEHYLVKYTSDGVLEVKYQSDIEFEDGLPPDDRESIEDFRAGDVMMAHWRDGIYYEAVVLNIDGKLFPIQYSMFSLS